MKNKTMIKRSHIPGIAGSVSRGFSLVTAIFLLVVLSALGAVMVTFFTVQQQSAAVDIMGSRAYQAARAGIEWAALGVSATAQGTLWAGCAGGATIPVNQMSGTMAPFSVVVTCTSTLATQGSTTIYVYSINSIATGPNGAAVGSPDYVSRTITARMED